MLATPQGNSIQIGLNTPTTQNFGDAAAIGSAIDAVRSDHKHGFPGMGVNNISTQNFGDAMSKGVAVDAARSDHKHAFPSLPIPDNWSLIQTLTPSGVATINSSALGTWDLLYIEYKLTGAAGSNQLDLRVNSDSGTNYNQVTLNSTPAFVLVTANVAWTGIGDIWSTAVGGSFIIDNRTSQATINPFCGMFLSCGSPNRLVSGSYNLSPITVIQFFSGTTFTGTIKIYGRNM